MDAQAQARAVERKHESLRSKHGEAELAVAQVQIAELSVMWCSG